MQLIFLGAAETVTGSKFLLKSGDTQVLIDCGLFQGYKWLRERNWQPIAVDLDKLDAVILTHAHLDHSGYIPALYQQGFRGKVYTHHATTALCSILLPDSGHIQEEDAKFYARHKIGKHAEPKPLYDRATAEQAMSLFHSIEFGEAVKIGELSFHLQAAGHILGAACVIIEAEGKRIGFSGDVGRFNDFFMRPPKPLPALDALVLESTYGNRLHEDSDPEQQLADIVTSTAERGGVLLIPSFAVGRAQTVQYLLAKLMAENRIPQMPIFLDSPMAIDVSDIYCEHHAQHRLSAAQCKMMNQAVTYTRSVEDSKSLAGIKYPHIIIAGSGMATGGRILHHFKRLLANHRTHVLFVGYQAGGTRGDKMLQGADAVKIHGQWIDCRAQISVLHGLSGHADHAEITTWLQQSELDKHTAIHLVHGSPEALEAQRDHLHRHTQFKTNVASYHSVLNL